MRILVTGASGFIGAHLVSHLRYAGFHVRAAGRRALPLGGVEWVELPDVSKAEWPALCSGMDVVVHLAAIAHTRGVPAHTLRSVNQDAAIALAQALSPEQRLIFVSSIRAASGPCSAVEITEESAPQPTCEYGIAKRAAEEAILRLRPDACVLRPVTVYGRGAKHNMRVLSKLARCALPLPLGSLRAPRSYASVENICSAAAFAASEGVRGVFTVSDPDTASVSDIIGFYREAIGVPRRLLSVPNALAALGRCPGLRPLMSVTTQPLVARPTRLISAGWLPRHATTREGVFDWAKSGDTGLAPA